MAVGDGDKVEFGAGEAIVLDVGGHTNGHIAYYFADARKVFCGDALFALGCGRMFEGTPQQFWRSLKRLRDLPDETTVYWWVVSYHSFQFDVVHLSSADCENAIWRFNTNIYTISHSWNKYSAHEYTASNAKFALSVEPGNLDLVARAKEIMDKRSRNEPTVPSKIGEEKKTNPFLRVDISDEIRRNVGVTSSDTEEDAFAKVRSAKDIFRG